MHANITYIRCGVVQYEFRILHHNNCGSRVFLLVASSTGVYTRPCWHCQSSRYPATRRVYAIVLPFPQWHGLTQTRYNNYVTPGASFEAKVPRSCWLHYTCTTKLPVPRPRLPKAASTTKLSLLRPALLFTTKLLFLRLQPRSHCLYYMRTIKFPFRQQLYTLWQHPPSRSFARKACHWLTEVAIFVSFWHLTLDTHFVRKGCRRQFDSTCTSSERVAADDWKSFVSPGFNTWHALHAKGSRFMVPRRHYPRLKKE